MYIALGDSITAGESATSVARAYPSLVVSILQHQRGGALNQGEVLAEPGWTSQALTSAVMANGPVILSQAKVISVWVGGDDLADAALMLAKGAPRQLIAQSLANYGYHLKHLVGYIRKFSRATLILCTQYNPFPNTPLAQQGIQSLNQVTQTVAGLSNAIVAPTHLWFEGRQAELIAGYRTGRIRDVLTTPMMPVHPNNRGHRVIAEGLTGIILG